jgi:hypothetical protein
MSSALFAQSAARESVHTLTQFFDTEYLNCYAAAKSGQLPKDAPLVIGYRRANLRKEPYVVIKERVLSKIDHKVLKLAEKLSGQQKDYFGEVVTLACTEFERPVHSHIVEIICQSEAIPQLLHSSLVRSEVAKRIFGTILARL